jgi:hypothetical protein
MKRVSYNEQFNTKKIEQNALMIFPCQKDNCTLEHVSFNLFIDVHTNMIIFAK